MLSWTYFSLSDLQVCINYRVTEKCEMVGYLILSYLHI